MSAHIFVNSQCTHSNSLSQEDGINISKYYLMYKQLKMAIISVRKEHCYVYVAGIYCVLDSLENKLNFKLIPFSDFKINFL